MKRSDFKSIDEYIATFPSDTQTILEKIRQTIKSVAPDATETISYKIPTFKLNGKYLIYFAGFKKHVSLYPAPRSVAAFKKELLAYKGEKGTVQFPIDKPLPLSLIKKIVKFRVNENEEKNKSLNAR